MTNEEAIEWLKHRQERLGKNEADELAIKALKDQPKYEKALQLACEQFFSNDMCPMVDCPSANDDEPECYNDKCTLIVKNWLKCEAGIEAIK